MSYDKAPTLRRECGTLPGWQAHRDAGERACSICRKVKHYDLTSAEPTTLAKSARLLTTGHVITARFPTRFDSKCAECKTPVPKGSIMGRTSAGKYLCQECGA